MKEKLLTKEQVRKFIKENDIKYSEDVEDAFRDMFKMVLEEMLNAELDKELGYEKYDYKNKETTNLRNGHSKKKVHSTYGEEDIREALKCLPELKDTYSKIKIIFWPGGF